MTSRAEKIFERLRKHFDETHDLIDEIHKELDDEDGEGAEHVEKKVETRPDGTIIRTTTLHRVTRRIIK